MTAACVFLVHCKDKAKMYHYQRLMAMAHPQWLMGDIRDDGDEYEEEEFEEGPRGAWSPNSEEDSDDAMYEPAWMQSLLKPSLQPAEPETCADLRAAGRDELIIDHKQPRPTSSSSSQRKPSTPTEEKPSTPTEEKPSTQAEEQPSTQPTVKVQARKSVEVVDEDGVRTYTYQRPRVTKSGEVKYTQVRRKYVPKKILVNERRVTSTEIIKAMKQEDSQTKGVGSRYEEYSQKMQAKGFPPYSTRAFIHEFRTSPL